jgi:hypothetical protein
MKTSLKYETDKDYRQKVVMWTAHFMIKAGKGPITQINRKYRRMINQLKADRSFDPSEADIRDAAEYLIRDTIHNGQVLIDRAERYKNILQMVEDMKEVADDTPAENK